MSVVGTGAFRDFVLERLAALHGLYKGRMLGGYSLHSAGRFFCIVFDDRRHFETISVNLRYFLSRMRLALISVEKRFSLKYRELATMIADDGGSFAYWAGKAAQE